MILICAPQLAVSMYMRGSWPLRTAICLALFPAAGAAAALLYGWLDGYWGV
jgi:hypothetical protein